jgi:UDP-N-acetylmuramoylalanine-D-glutamate ligase
MASDCLSGYGFADGLMMIFGLGYSGQAIARALAAQDCAWRARAARGAGFCR